MTLAIKWQVVLVLWVLQCLRVLFGWHSPRITLPKTNISPPRHSWRWFSLSLSVGYDSSLEGTVFFQETTLSFDGKTSGTASKNQGRFLKFTPSFARTHKNSARDGIRYHIIWSYCWWFKNPANQLRLVVYPCLSMFIPLFTDVLYVLYIQTVVGLGISESFSPYHFHGLPIPPGFDLHAFGGVATFASFTVFSTLTSPGRLRLPVVSGIWPGLKVLKVYLYIP